MSTTRWAVGVLLGVLLAVTPAWPGQDLSEHLAGLESTDPTARARAAKALGAAGNEAAIPSLVAAMRGAEDSGTRFQCRRALGKIGTPAALEALLEEAERTGPREGPIYAFSDFEDPRAAEALGRALDAGQTSAAQALRKLGKLAVPVLASLVSHENVEVRREVAKELGQIDIPECIDPLFRMVDDPDGDVRRRATSSISMVMGPRIDDPSPRQLDRLLPLLHDADSGTRAASVRVFGRLDVPYEPAYAAILALVHDPGWKVRFDAVGALGKIGKPGSLTVLTAALSDQDDRVRQSAIHAAVKVGGPSVEGDIIAALRGSSPAVQRVALGELGTLGGPESIEPVVATFALEPRTAWAAVTALKKMLPRVPASQVQQELLRGLGNPDPLARRYSAFMLAEVGNAAAVPDLMTALDDEDAMVRRQAVVTLGALDDASAASRLVALLDDADLDVRRESARALVRLGSAPGIEAIEAACEAGDLAVIAGGIDHFIRQGRAGSEETLIRALEDYGTRTTASALLNSGNSTLYEAARAWAKKKGYSIQPLPGPRRVGWGKHD